ADRQELRRELVALADIHAMDPVGQPGLLQHDMDLVAVRRRPAVEVDHRKAAPLLLKMPATGDPGGSPPPGQGTGPCGARRAGLSRRQSARLPAKVKLRGRTMLTQSYVHGASAAPLIGDTVGSHFDKAVERWPEREALVVRHQNIRWSYRDLQREVDALAAGLLALGLEPGERIGIWSHNNSEWVVTQLATAKAGLILVNINPAYRLAEVEYALTKVGCRALITMPTFKTSDYIGMLRELAPELDGSVPGHLEARRLPALKTVIRLGNELSRGMFNFAQVPQLGRESERCRLAELAHELQFDDPVNIQFTSGTTGHPKGATLTHHNILNNGFFIGEAMRLT